MNKYIIASCLIAFVFGWTLSQSDRCSCDQYYNQAECKNQCIWNSKLSACIVPPCDQYGVDKQCTEESDGYCYWNTTNCIPFQGCESLQGNSTQSCQNLVFTCTWQSGSNCITNKCSLYNSTTCPTYCYNNGQSCQEYTSCQQYNTSSSCRGGYCKWTNTNNTCNQAVCSNLNQGYCTNINFLDSDSIIPCFYNGTSCTEAQASDLNNLTLCKTNTQGIYHWSSTNATDGSCTACEKTYGLLVQIMFTLLLLLA